MKTTWDYTQLADAYLKRPDYADEAIDKMLFTANVTPGNKVCDVGAGAAHLTLKLAEHHLSVVAVEPNDAMRANGIRRTTAFSNVVWFEGTGEKTGQPPASFDLVTFGSSFNVTNRELALQETARILKPGGWFACMWNHRDLVDPLQSAIEAIIKRHIPNYDYGTRREDQTDVIKKCKLFGEVHKIEEPVFHKQTIKDCIESWHSHATLRRQANGKFSKIILEIENLLLKINTNEIVIPYTTRIWLAQRD